MEDHLTDKADPYAIVLADLRAQRDRIDTAITALEGLRGSAGSHVKPTEASLVEPPEMIGGVISDGLLLGMSIADATNKVLSLRKRKMTTSEVLADLKAGGLALSSKDPGNVVNSVLYRRFQSVGDIVRIERGTWGLKTWYPGRNFNKTKAASAEKPASDMLDVPIDVEDSPGEEHDDASSLI
jgi:hypothetical protein